MLKLKRSKQSQGGAASAAADDDFVWVQARGGWDALLCLGQPGVWRLRRGVAPYCK